MVPPQPFCGRAGENMIALASRAGGLLLAVWTTSAAAGTLIGIPVISDADTVTIGSVKVRLSGVDAPETKQLCLDAKGQPWECGKAARDQLIKKSAGRTWVCSASGQDKYQRSLAKCHVEGEDIQRWLVRSGLALSFTRFSHDYDADEKAARAARVGLWSGAFIAPWDWRDRNKSTVVLGAVSVPIHAQKILLRPDPPAPLIEPLPLTTTAIPATTQPDPPAPITKPLTPTTITTPTTTPPKHHVASGPCQHADDRAANGSRCGKRAADERKSKSK